MQRLACCLLSLVGFCCLLFCPARGIESPQFTAIHTESDFEVRLYRESSWVSAPSIEISFEKATRQGFHRVNFPFISQGSEMACDIVAKILLYRLYLTSFVCKPKYLLPQKASLFQYIQGANLNNSRIAMTAPVLTSIVPDAGPLHSSAYYVRLYLPAKFHASPPVPLPELNLRADKWASRCIAVRKFSGFARDGNIVKEADALAVSLSRSPWANSTYTEGSHAYSIAQYSSPFRFIGRVNEVWVDIDGSQEPGCKPSTIAAY